MINYAVIGTSWITETFIAGAMENGKMRLAGVYSRSEEKAAAFAKKQEAAALGGEIKLYTELEALAVANEVVLEDNQIEVDLGEAETYEAVCETHTNALDVSTLAPFTAAHLDGTVYLGIIANTPRLERALAYFTYLARA